MPGFRVFTGNSTKRLMEILRGRLTGLSGDPMKKETVVVQSQGMEKWLSVEIAVKNGICANIDFPFPRHFAKKLFRYVTGLPEKYPFTREVMAWDIMKILPGMLNRKEFEPVKNYVSGDSADLKLFQISFEIAKVFDQYLVYRPDMLLEWDVGRNPLSGAPGAAWQYELWRRLNENAPPGSKHLAAMKAEFISAVRDVDISRLPERVHIFGISSLPLFYLDMFRALASRIDVDFYYFNPCREYWAEAYSKKEISRFARIEVPEDSMYFYSGNDLLASMGRKGREFFILMLESNASAAGETDCFEEPGEDTLLKCIQSDILNLRNRGRGGYLPGAFDPEDKSITVHSCHGQVRELEVLYDCLLEVFASNPGIRPGDVAVMAPDISFYAPFIDAVFGTPETESMRIPFSIADQTADDCSGAAGLILQILSLPEKRVTVTEVLDILENEIVYQKFGLTENELPLIRQWLSGAGFRWGLDGKFKASAGLPEYNESTLDFILKRLTLGCMMSDSLEQGLYEGIYPYGNPEGDSALTAGKFISFAGLLKETVEAAARRHTLEGWIEFLNKVMNGFFAPDENTADETRELRNSLDESGIGKIKNVSGFDGKVSSSVIKYFLRNLLSGMSTQQNFLTGGVTFGTLLPMRAIPFKVICLIGMNDGAFPRNPRKSGFDLRESKKRLCDPSRRHEDRFLFLESLMAARERLIITFHGQDVKENTEIPPSVLVSELLDFIDESFSSEATGKTSDEILVKHPLQPFSKSYFDSSSGQLFSYSRKNKQAAETALSRERNISIPGFVPPEKKEGQELSVETSLEDIVRFFRNPARYVTEHRFRVNLEDNYALELPEKENIDKNALTEYKIKTTAFNALNSGIARERLYELLKASALIPPGEPGRSRFMELYAKVNTLVTEFRRRAGTGKPLTAESRIDTESGRIFCAFRNLYNDSLVFYRCASLKPVDRINAWLRHLAACVSLDTFTGGTVVVQEGITVRYEALSAEKAGHIVNGLFKFFIDSQNSIPAFFPESSMAYAENLMSSGNRAKAFAAARKKWTSDYKHSPERDNPYFMACFDGNIPDADEIEKHAMMFFQPMLEHEKAEEL